jgi:hypothetical protein
MKRIVAEKTGYPEDSIDATMDLESDLGIDSIKRVEILSALAGALPHIPEPDPTTAAAARTLHDVQRLFSGAVAPQPAPAVAQINHRKPSVPAESASNALPLVRSVLHWDQLSAPGFAPRFVHEKEECVFVAD